MRVGIIKWIIILCATVNFGFMAFDGMRALTVGDYIKPETGEYAGELGPWTKLVEWVGLQAESTAMKAIFVIWGLSGLIITLCFALNYMWGRQGLLIISVLSIWYLIPGTVLSVLQILLLSLYKSFANR